MTQPHQCRCAICGEIGVITPALPNVFTPAIQTYAYKRQQLGQVTTGSMTITPAESTPVATCAHGYTVCAVCKFPATP